MGNFLCFFIMGCAVAFYCFVAFFLDVSEVRWMPFAPMEHQKRIVDKENNIIFIEHSADD